MHHTRDFEAWNANSRAEFAISMNDSSVIVRSSHAQTIDTVARRPVGRRTYRRGSRGRFFMCDQWTRENRYV